MIRTDLARRRLINTIVLLVACGFTALLYRLTEISFRDTSEWTGWLMVAVIVGLLLYAVRRRLSTLLLGKMSTWLQLHLYLGFFTFFVFLLHIDWRIPSGWITVGLSVSFFGVIVTGVIGIFWSRRLPELLTALGDEVLYERIPIFAAQLRDSVEQKVLNAVENSGTHELADFYQNIGHAYFAKPSFQWSRLYRKYQPQRQIERELNTLRYYIDNEGSKLVDELLSLVKKKSLLDAHYTFQGALRYWLFVHLAFALSVIPLILLHVILVYNFASI